MARYVGWYSNRMRGDRRKAEQEAQKGGEKEVAENDVIVVSGFKTKKVPPLMWRECIKKIWEVDPLLCKHCGGMMKIISFIYERKVIKKILDHLGLYNEDKSIRNRAPPLLRISSKELSSHMTMAGPTMRSRLLMCKCYNCIW